MKFLKLLFLVLLFEGCILIHSDDSVDLGGDYRYMPDPSAIVYNKGGNFEEGRFVVVDPKVKRHELYRNYIVAKSCDNCNDSASFTYWIIDKTRGIDSATPTRDIDAFYNRLKELKVEVRLSE